MDEKYVYIYELSGSRFKEIKGTVRLCAESNTNYAFAVPDNDKSSTIKVSNEEFRIYGSYVWTEKRSKERAAEIFKNKYVAQLKKEKAAVALTESKLDLLNKYYEGKK